MRAEETDKPDYTVKKSPDEIRKAARERQRKCRLKRQQERIDREMSEIKTLAQGADWMNQHSRGAYCPLGNCSDEDVMDCCLRRRQRND